MSKLHLSTMPDHCDLATFFHNAQAAPSLSPQEEQDLGWAVLNEGSPQAFERLFMANRHLVTTSARRFRDRGLDWTQLLEHGEEGLRTAVEQFDPGQGVRFSTHATWWIKYTIKRALTPEAATPEQPRTLPAPRFRADSPGAA